MLTNQLSFQSSSKICFMVIIRNKKFPIDKFVICFLLIFKFKTRRKSNSSETNGHKVVVIMAEKKNFISGVKTDRVCKAALKFSLYLQSYLQILVSGPLNRNSLHLFQKTVCFFFFWNFNKQV